jgi:hypothetical protein
MSEWRENEIRKWFFGTFSYASAGDSSENLLWMINKALGDVGAFVDLLSDIINERLQSTTACPPINQKFPPNHSP